MIAVRLFSACAVALALLVVVPTASHAQDFPRLSPPGQGTAPSTPSTPQRTPSLLEPPSSQATPRATAETRLEAIEVRGTIRVEAEAVRRAVGLRSGDVVDRRQIGDAVRAVYDMGFFDDIVVRARAGESGVILIVEVAEKPAVAEVRIEGNRRIKDDDLLEAIDIRTGSIFDERDVRRGVRRIEDEYREKGHYLVRVSWEVQMLSETTVEVIYNVEENAKVRIAAVDFVGNDQLEASELLSVMENRPGGVLGFMTPFGTFSRDKFSLDIQRLRLFYYENGFLDVSVGEPLVELSRDGSRLFLTIPIQEGHAYTVTGVSLGGDLIVPRDEVEALVDFSTGHTFTASQVRDQIELLTRFYRDMGYANANINMFPEQDPRTREVRISYDVDPGEIASIGRISVRGNRLTRDRVIRREMDIAEGEQYHATRIDLSRRYIQRLGFFESVQIRERPSPADPNVIDLTIEVVEQPTGNFQIGAGFSSYENFIATAQISQNNFFGRGQSLSFNATVSSIRTLFALRFFEPYLFDTRWQYSISLFNTQELFDNFDRRARGFSNTFGYRLTRDLTLSLGYKFEDVRVQPGGRRGRSAVRFAALFEDGLTSSLEGGLTWDRRDNRLFPTSGHYQAARLEVADRVLGSDNEFMRTRFISRWFASPIWDNWIFRVNTELGFLHSTRPDSEIPIFERFYVGGPNSVRGFERLALSPSRPVGRQFSPDAETFPLTIGGTKELIINFELEFPILQQLGLRGVAFIDAGNAFDIGEPLTLRLDLFESGEDGYGNLLRTAAGFGLRWRVPALGSLRFEWGFPLSPLEDERNMVFEFSIGESF